MQSPLSSALEHVRPTPLPPPETYAEAVKAAKRMAKACRALDANEITVMVGNTSVTFRRHDRPRVPPKAIEVRA